MRIGRMDQIVYPLSLDQRVLQRDLFRKDISTLGQALQTIRQDCAQKCGKPLLECIEHLTLAIEKYRDYYLNPESGRWHSELGSYRAELQTMFDTDGCTMKEIQDRANQELRQHIQNDLTTSESDPELVRTYKAKAIEMLEAGQDIEPVYDFLLDEQVKNFDDDSTARLAQEIQEAYTPTDRKAIYIRYYCTPSPSDSKRVQNFKSKYTRQFQQELSHDTVLEAMRKEALGSQSDDASHLHVRLNELQMAQSAHVKSLARKAEKDRKMKDFEPTPEPITVPCTLPDCGIRVDLEDEDYAGPIECGLCDWLSQKSTTRQRMLYCSSQHAEQDFHDHDQQYHACISGKNCYYYPDSPPFGTDIDMLGGICPSCASNNKISYFCSQLCFAKNAPAHRAEVGCAATSEPKDDLDLFEVTSEMMAQNQRAARD